MHYSLKQSLLAGASALVLSMGAAGAARAGDADALINVGTASVHDNTAVDNGSVRTNRIDNANNNGAGIVHEQQNNGSNNAISAATASTADVAGSNAPLGTDAITHSSTHDNLTVHQSYVPQAGAPDLPDRTNEIVDSFNGFDGIATVQQNNGDNNEIGAATANYGSAVPLGAVGQTATADSSTENQAGEQQFSPLTDGATVRSNLIDPSFNNANGIATVQQNNGNANAIAAATSVVGAPSADAVTQEATAIAHSENNFTVDGGATRSNEILNSFVNADGVITVQQNNGDANAVSAATAVFGTPGSAASLTQTAVAEDNDLDDLLASSFGGPAPVDRSNRIDPSFNGAGGVVTVQQNNGSANQVAAATAVAGVDGDVSGTVSQEARANFNDVGASTFVTGVDILGQVRENGIVDSFNNAAGVITVQQNNGDANTMNAATAVAGIDGAVGGDLSQNAQSDDAEIADGGPVIANVLDATRSNTIDPSFRNVTGTVTVQQNNGSANTMQASTAVAAADSVAGDVSQEDANAQFNIVSEPGTFDGGSDRDNAIAGGSFNNAAGTVTVQQNNGDANTINASTGVVAVAGAVGGDLSQDADAEDNDVVFFGNAAASSARNNAVTDSFANASGTITVQQNNGDANSVNAATLVASAGSVGGNVNQNDLSADGNDIVNSEVSDDGSDRGNAITNSFNGVGGTTVVQQNNGNGNSLNAATAVLAVGGTVGGNVSQAVDVRSSAVSAVSATSVNASRDNTIDPSFTNADGIHTVQQNNGDANSMNAGVAVVSSGEAEGDAAQAAAASNALVQSSALEDELSARSNLIDNSFRNASGIVTVQQNNGSGNVFQAGAAVLQMGTFEAFGVQLGNMTQSVNAGGTVQGNDVEDTRSNRSNGIETSFDGADGIVTLQQNNGDANVLAAATAVASLTGDFADFDDNLSQTVEAGGTVATAESVDGDLPAGTIRQPGDGGRDNLIDSSFQNGAGVATVQQNNGSNNVMASATGVMVSDAQSDSEDGTEEVVGQSAFVHATVGDSVASHDSLGGHPPPQDRDNAIRNSFGGLFRGVATVQQNNGDNNVMASATAVAANFADPNADDLDEVTSAAATAGSVEGNFDTDTASNRRNAVSGSFRNASGIVGVQQNNGSNNLIGAATTVAANFGTASPHGPATGTATGSAAVTGNAATASDLVDRENGVTGSFSGFKGLANVQQNNGGNNAVAAATTVSASDRGTSGFGPAVSLALLGASVSGNSATIAATNGVDPGYGNLVSGSFNNAAGVVTVQQNNGSNNAIQSAISVTANFN